MAKKEKKSFQESKYDPNLLREMCEQNVDAQTALKKLNLSSLQSLRQHLMRLSVEDQILRTLPGLYTRASSLVRITKQGLKISPKKLEITGIDLPVNTEFKVEYDENEGTILLTRVTPDGESSEPISEGEESPG
jgi:hypothetical protein